MNDIFTKYLIYKRYINSKNTIWYKIMILIGILYVLNNGDGSLSVFWGANIPQWLLRGIWKMLNVVFRNKGDACLALKHTILHSFRRRSVERGAYIIYGSYIYALYYYIYHRVKRIIYRISIFEIFYISIMLRKRLLDFIIILWFPQS